jgi:coenzyme F420-0:L-glutamate ligase/coenzyme F420-1:gamma-L-glutamate ligase
MQNDIRIIPVHHIGELQSGDNLAKIVTKALDKQNLSLEAHDILVVTQKIVSKAEGRVMDLVKVKPSSFALQIAEKYKKDPRYIELILQESKRIVRMDRGIIISETHHGFICANAGVDASNIGRNKAALLPINPDESAKALRKHLQKKVRGNIAVIISDTWGRPWREGQVNFAIGSNGLDVLTDYQGKKDAYGYELKVSLIAIADELASAAELVMGKTDNVPVAIIRGYELKISSQGSKKLLRQPSKDLFR